eukprot:1156671-Pelagomonas_calceolata.AAC.2
MSSWCGFGGAGATWMSTSNGAPRSWLKFWIVLQEQLNGFTGRSCKTCAKKKRIGAYRKHDFWTARVNPIGRC